MGDDDVTRFIQHYERLTRHILVEMPECADLFATLNEDRSPHSILGARRFRPRLRPPTSSCPSADPPSVYTASEVSRSRNSFGRSSHCGWSPPSTAIGMRRSAKTTIALRPDSPATIAGMVRPAA